MDHDRHPAGDQPQGSACRRIVLAQLIEAGSEMLRNVEEARLGHMRQLVETMSQDEQRTVLDALQTMAAARERLDATHDREREVRRP